ncbi:MAG: hypothetical protein ACKOHM_08530 [Spartobacteria bacterium]
MRGTKTSSKSRGRLLVILLICATLAGALVVLAIQVGRFIHSPDFARFLASQAGEALKLEASLDPLRWEGDSALSEGLTLVGDGTDALERLEAKALRADWNWRALLAGAWEIEHIEIQNLSATFKPKTETASPVPASTPAEKSHSRFASWLPSRFELGSFEVRKADLRFGEIQSSNQTLTIQRVSGGYNIESRGGSVAVPGLPLLAHSWSRLRERDGVFHLDEARFFLPSAGSLVASGNTGQNARLTIAWDGVPAAGLPFPVLAEHLDGTSQGQATLDAQGVWRGRISFTGASLRNLPLLKKAASFLGDPAWSRPQLQKLGADFEWSAGNLTITNLVVESSGLARIEGAVRIAHGGKLSGELQLGLDPATLKLLPGARETLFAATRNGWYWSPVQLSGTLSEPKEDLSPRLTACLAGAAILNQTGKALDAVPPTAIDATKDLLNIFTPLLP